ncbi:Na(+)/glucose symporter [Limihaloglobus sulfuriphilus]|uniref:Na(+)/glucose symporter n=1 Tax=Limihaloglobus sulfuriphilus TaxID=1851148 RepID=A0A1Q2MAV7_9BACT|nr:sodium:solute symporter family protein [Limihaloglobus sulfuriphilus]AQQ69804.1 Na(+)/glucose symporter [Limihaloglobus sulfuriphilus]
MFGLSLIDIIVILAYFSVTIAIGFWAMRRIQNQEDYFLGGRRFGKFIQIFAAFGQATSASTAISATTTTMANGASGIWSTLNYVFGTPVLWMIAPWYRRLRLLTMGDFFEDRYGSKTMGAVYAIVSSVGFMIMISLGVNAMSKTIMALTPKTLDELSVVEVQEYERSLELDRLSQADYRSLTPEQQTRLDKLRLENPRNVFSHVNKKTLIIIVCLVVLIYAVAGGLEAAFLTDTIQGVFIIILSIALIPFGWAKINSIYGGEGVMGALTTIHQHLPESYFEIFGSPKTIDFTWYYVAGLTLMVTINLGVQANQLVTTGSAKDEYTARLGFTVGIYMKRLCTILWGVFALSAALLYGSSVSDPDLVYGYAVLDLLGPLKMGLVGLMIACLMSALMSTADCLMITSSSLLTHNVYRLILPDHSEKMYVIAGRVLGAIVVIGGCWIAMFFESIFAQLKLTWEVTAVFAACFWMGMLWRKANRRAAWASIIVTGITFFVIPVFLPAIMPSLRTNVYLLTTTNPAPLERYYTAHKMDVEARNKEISDWQLLDETQKLATPQPEPLAAGEKFSKIYKLPQKSIFWTQGIKEDKYGIPKGYGMLNAGLVVLDKAGLNLSDKPYAFNETLRVLLRVIVPFGVLLLASLFTRKDDKNMLDRFYVKMKTPAMADREADVREMELSLQSPGRFNYKKMLPQSDWEFCKWDRVSIIGFSISVLVAVGIIYLFLFLVSLGG